MTKVTILKNKKNEYVGFKAVGHAGYGEVGEDIVCAAISVLTINTINAIDAYTDDEFSLKTDEKTGSMVFQLNDIPSKETALLLDTMVLGLQAMEDNTEYEDYIDLIFEEV